MMWRSDSLVVHNYQHIKESVLYKLLSRILPLPEELFTIDGCGNSALGSQPLGLLCFTRVFWISASVRGNNALCTAHANFETAVLVKAKTTETRQIYYSGNEKTWLQHKTI